MIVFCGARRRALQVQTQNSSNPGIQQVRPLLKTFQPRYSSFKYKDIISLQGYLIPVFYLIDIFTQVPQNAGWRDQGAGKRGRERAARCGRDPAVHAATHVTRLFLLLQLFTKAAQIHHQKKQLTTNALCAAPALGKKLRLCC